MRAALRRAAVVAGAAVTLLLWCQLPAQAHPLGNFTVNHYHGLRVLPDRIEDDAVIDRAEIPTLQAAGAVRADGGPARHAALVCWELGRGLRADAGGRALVWRVDASRMELRAGQAGLETSRISCRLSAAADLSHPADITFADPSDAGRVGWREITARAAGGARLSGSDVPVRSASGRLGRYPQELLGDPLDVRTARLRVGAGAGAGAVPAAGAPGAGGRPGGAEGWMAGMDGRLAALSATDRLTLPVGLAAVLLSLLLGAAHAALPGHGKTVMAACMAGRRGGVKDAVAVGATVTFTHTAGVLALGLVLTVSASLAADRMLSWLGVASGALVAGVGVMLLRGARPENVPGHTHTHDHGHGHHHHPAPYRRRTLLGMGIAGGLVPSPSALVVLLGAITLNRTAFGIGLVLGYGVGMAAVLTAAGLLVARFGDRTQGMLGQRMRWVRRLRPWTPVLTASLVVAVGAGLALRSAGQLLY
ncbi:nickel transporter [Streptomyces sp. NPDC050738]|uniref:nickel/cobalt transporter n=1 Tax=Streptomyces sp. NPDC050738 TaxID=3154744 RepID=UPI0034240724